MRSGVRVAVASALVWLRCSATFAPSSPDGPPQYCTVYNHMVKSGGTSIKQQLEDSSAREGHAPPGICTSDGTTPPGECGKAIHNSSVIMGYAELLRNPLDELGRDCKYFTMIRNPISRLVSAFYYCPEDHDQQLRLNRPLKWCGNIANPMPATARLLEFARRSMWSSMAYRQMLHSIFCPPTFEFCDENHKIKNRPTGISSQLGRECFEKMEDILSTYVAVGIYEEWSLSMQLFDANVPSSVRKWDSGMELNKGLHSRERETLLQWAYESPEILQVLAADLMLYDFSLSLFRGQVHDAFGDGGP